VDIALCRENLLFFGKGFFFNWFIFLPHLRFIMVLFPKKTNQHQRGGKNHRFKTIVYCWGDRETSSILFIQGGYLQKRFM